MEEQKIDSSDLQTIGEEACTSLTWILEGMGIEADVEVDTRDGQILLDIVGGSDSSITIGRKGQTLEALQVLVTRITARQHPDVLGRTKILIDVEGYRERRRINLVDLAIKSAGEVRDSGEPAFLGPMKSYERYIVHSTLKEEQGIMTSSRGEGALKQIVIEVDDGNNT